MNPADFSILEAGAKLRDGSLSAVELTRAHLDRIGSRDPVYRAFVNVLEDAALVDAARADEEIARGIDKGPLHGIPIGVKDLIDTKGVRTAYGSRLYVEHVPDEDAEAVKGLKRAGAILLGKLATYEFALVGPSFDLPFPPARNPRNPARITGGSSSGSAAAVAGGLLRTAIGTDTGGSVRSPAAYCGVVGLKPTFGRVLLEGIFPLSPSLDHLGVISASVAEAVLTLDAILADAATGPPKAAAASRLGEGVDGLRLGYARDWFARDPEVEPNVVSAMDDAASELSLLGGRIEEISLPDHAIFEACGRVILHAEALAIHAETMRTQGRDYGRLAFQSLASGICVGDGDLALAQRAARALQAALDEDVFRHVDALITATALTTAPPFSAFDGRSAVWTSMRTIAFNVTGHPALSIPAGFAAGLPIGLQIVGRRFEEAQVCRIADAFERATDHAVMRPPALAGSTIDALEVA